MKKVFILDYEQIRNIPNYTLIRNFPIAYLNFPWLLTVLMFYILAINIPFLISLKYEIFIQISFLISFFNSWIFLSLFHSFIYSWIFLCLFHSFMNIPFLISFTVTWERAAKSGSKWNFGSDSCEIQREKKLRRKERFQWINSRSSTLPYDVARYNQLKAG